ncbi:MAG: mechanosensitive ion channel family protein [Phycisphaerales bacterium]|nr:MAG: mechanosensitive ion channel family protein [Phycisphaerales bacterium]
MKPLLRHAAFLAVLLGVVFVAGPLVLGTAVAAPQAGVTDDALNNDQSDDPGRVNEEAAGTTASPSDNANSFVDQMTTVFDKTPLWAWLMLAGCIFGGVVLGWFAKLLLSGIAKRLKGESWTVRSLFFEDAASPASLAFTTLGIAVGLRFLEMPEDLHEFSRNAITFLYTLSIGWLIFNLVDIVDVGLRRVTEASATRLSGQLVPLIRKALRIFVIVVFVLFIAQNVFGVDITAWLAGLGIAGLAVSLAAQDSIKNIFGSITVMLDKPFAVGDRIVFSGTDGFVEEVGFRSTKIRTFTGHLITVPNMKFIDGTVENVSARPFLRRTLDVTIPYDTTAEKIDEAVQLIKDILAADDMTEPFRLDERPPRIYFNEYNAASLNISVAYWYFLDADKGHDWWGFLAYNQEFNRRLFKTFTEAGIGFAFPTQTLYLAGDPDRQLSVKLLKDETSTS